MSIIGWVSPSNQALTPEPHWTEFSRPSCKGSSRCIPCRLWTSSFLRDKASCGICSTGCKFQTRTYACTWHKISVTRWLPKIRRQRQGQEGDGHLRRQIQTACISARFLWPNLPRYRRPYGLGDWHHSSAVCVQQYVPGKQEGLGLPPKMNFSPLLSGDPPRVPPSRAYLLSPCWIRWADFWILALYLPMIRLIFEMAGDERDGQRLQL
jgi:hypothetical protein